ncbi:unnamed protein product [Enterobius vermicularis]|uniref:MFS domain-containing protein n=1 Tax=Enterobius vermicularis TaxID=51028 RepID=A0A0N4V6Q0_ENTVE|nr:unnamed protein product [Enterobius vermicularis]
MTHVRDMSIWVPRVDGGWGWIVVLGSFLIHVFADGIVYSFGILLNIFMTEFNSDNAETSLIVGLLAGITLSVGPIASAFANRFGCRLTTIVGCLASLRATSVKYLWVSVGCVMGCGAGFMYCPAIIIVTVYFEKKRAMATGIAVCGAGVGTLVFAPLAAKAITIWGWHGAFYLYTVVLILCALCGSTFRPLPFVKVEDQDKSIEEKKGELKAVKADVNAGGDVSHKVDWFLSGLRSLSLCLTSVRVLLSWSLLDVFYTGSVTSLPRKNHEKFRSLTMLKEDNTALDGVADKNANGYVSQERNRMREIFRSLAGTFFVVVDILDLTLLADPIFMLFAISNFLTSIGFNAPLMFIPAHAENMGVTPANAAYLLSAFGAFNTIGRVLFGIVSDRKLPTKFGKDVKRNRLWIYIVSLCICGMVTCFVFVYKSYMNLLVYAAIFGLTISSYVCLTSVLLVDLLGLDKLTSAFGILLLFQGLATFIGPYVSGKLADIMDKSYDLTFVFCGVCLLMSGAMLFAIYPLRKRQRQSENVKKADVL